jgi:hypothetical protein|tara:strand:+ start:14776 stop:15027 length:252 start_codon:yes stop_codon:yes gene_type:complete
MLNFIKKTIIIIFSIIAITFFVNNRYFITISLKPYGYESDIRLFILLIIFFLFGVIFAHITNFCYNLRKKLSDSCQKILKVKK